MSIKYITTGQKLPGARKDTPGFNRFGADPNSFFGQLQRIPAKYYLEIRKGNTVDAAISFPYDPSTMQYNRNNPNSITYTLGGVIREAHTIRSHDIILSGRSGIAQRISYTRDGGISNLTGIDAFKEFDEFLKRYTELCNLDFGIRNKVITSPDEYIAKVQQTGRSSNSVQLVLRCIDEDLHLFVEPVNFSYGRDAAANKHDITYTLQLKAYDYAYSTAYTNFLLNGLDTFDGYINAIGGVVGVVSNVVENVSNDYVLAVRKPLRSATSALNRVKELPGNVGSLTRNAAGIISDFVEVITTAVSIVPSEEEFSNYFEGLGDDVVLEATRHNIRQTAQGMLNTPEYLGDDVLDARTNLFVANMALTLNEAENLRGLIPKEYYDLRHKGSEYRLGEWLSNEGNLSQLNQGPGTTSGVIDRRQAFRYEIGRYDDLIQIATKLTGIASNARFIQDYNGWRDFRRNAMGDYPQPGDVIYIPNSLLNSTNPFLEQGDLIGYDIKVPYNDAVLNDVTNEIVIVGGAENVKQMIKHALLTVAGELPGFETFGLKNLSRISDTAYLASLIRDLLISDPRIIDINNIEIEVKQDTVIVSLDIKSVLNDTFSFRAPYPI